jgi:predicted Zn-ribbon and HTH transcriptional regulator
MNQQLTQKEKEIELVNALTIIARGSVSSGVMQMVASDTLEKCGIEVPSHEIIND